MFNDDSRDQCPSAVGSSPAVQCARGQ